MQYCMVDVALFLVSTKLASDTQQILNIQKLEPFFVFGTVLGGSEFCSWLYGMLKKIMGSTG